MKKYYYDSKRGFANEFAIISVEQTNKKEVALFSEYYARYGNSNNANWKLYQITAKQARKIVAGERTQERAYIRAGLNTVCNPVGATEITTATEYFREW